MPWPILPDPFINCFDWLDLWTTTATMANNVMIPSVRHTTAILETNTAKQKKVKKQGPLNLNNTSFI